MQRHGQNSSGRCYLDYPHERETTKEMNVEVEYQAYKENVLSLPSTICIKKNHEAMQALGK